MVCIYCTSSTQVVNSRLQRRSNHVWRRRQCTACRGIFTTEEHAELSGAVMVANASGKLQNFNRDMLFLSIYESCKHRESAIKDASALTLIVIGDLLKHIKQGLIERRVVVDATHKVLKRFDQAAATYYAAYHPLPRE